jgi:hypothetical protein
MVVVPPVAVPVAPDLAVLPLVVPVAFAPDVRAFVFPELALVGDVLLPGVVPLVVTEPSIGIALEPKVVEAMAVPGEEVPLLPVKPELVGTSVTGALFRGDGCPSPALTMRSPNSSVVVRRPSALMGNSNACVRVAAPKVGWPSTPKGVSRF